MRDDRRNRFRVIPGTLLASILCWMPILAASGGRVLAQTPEPVAVPVAAGGFLHGLIKSGSTPLPGVAVTATNTLTGKRFATTTDITGAWSMKIPQNGRYVVRTDFTAFAPSTHEALINAASRDQTVDFDLQLASRAAQQEARDQQTQAAAGAMPSASQISQAMRQLSSSGALSLVNSLATGTDAAEGGTNATGVATPGAATNSAFGTDSVAISGQAGTVSPLAGMDPDRIRDAIETIRAQAGGGFFGGGDAGGGFGGGPGGGGGGGRGNFRNFRADQPHGALFWNGGNSALNALPFRLPSAEGAGNGAQPQYSSNRFGLTFIGAPYIPRLVKPSGKDTLFLTLSGQRNSTPFDQYALVPDAAERSSCSGASLTPACKLLAFFPLPNLAAANSAGQAYNYYFASTGESNSTQAGVRYMRGLGANAASATRGGMGGGGRRNQQAQGLRQSINSNFNWSHSASDNLNVFPELGGKQASDNYSLQVGYSLGYRKLNNNLQAGWNRTRSETTNFFTNTSQNVAEAIGITGPNGVLNSDPLNYGVPNVVLSGFSSGLSEQQPGFRIQQTISLTEALSWIHGKHNYRFGGDYRRVHQDVLGGSNATGTLYFTGYATGTALGDLLAGLPQETSIAASSAKSYLRQNVWDIFAQDDFRPFSYLSLSYGLRYEFFSPFSEKYDHLAALGTSGDFSQVSAVYPGCSATLCGEYPSTLVYPFRAGLAPRLGIALRLPKSTVVRAGYAINFTNGQYANFASIMAHQPPFANVQTNEATAAAPISLATSFPISEGRQAPTYALDPHYTLPYVQVWNIDVQKTLPAGIVLNAGFNGSKGTHLDITSAPRPTTQANPFGLTSDVLFNYEQSAAFSSFSAATVRLRKRLQKGVSMGANYQYSHSIDNAGSIGGTSTVVAQNWQNLLAEEGNSSFDQRHRVTGDYLFELPFGKDKAFLNGGGAASRVMEGFSISGSFTFATGMPLTPTYAAAIADVARGTAGSLRPNKAAGVSITSGGGSLEKWFNATAFQIPQANAFGNASRNSISAPGTISNAMSLSKTMQMGDTRSLEMRATAGNVFNTVQYSGVDTNLSSPTAGQVTSAAGMRQFTFLARFRF